MFLAGVHPTGCSDRHEQELKSELFPNCQKSTDRVRCAEANVFLSETFSRPSRRPRDRFFGRAVDKRVCYLNVISIFDLATVLDPADVRVCFVYAVFAFFISVCPRRHS